LPFADGAPSDEAASDVPLTGPGAAAHTAPNPGVKAGVVLPEIKKLTLTILLPSAVKSRCGLKGVYLI